MLNKPPWPETPPAPNKDYIMRDEALSEAYHFGCGSAAGGSIGLHD